MGIPSADDLSKMKHLQSLASSHIDSDQIKRIAAKLLATMFYFETTENVMEQVDGSFVIQGKYLPSYSRVHIIPNRFRLHSLPSTEPNFRHCQSRQVDP
jgi:hypothetical protein